MVNSIKSQIKNRLNKVYMKKPTYRKLKPGEYVLPGDFTFHRIRTDERVPVANDHIAEIAGPVIEFFRPIRLDGSDAITFVPLTDLHEIIQKGDQFYSERELSVDYARGYAQKGLRIDQTFEDGTSYWVRPVPD